MLAQTLWLSCVASMWVCWAVAEETRGSSGMVGWLHDLGGKVVPALSATRNEKDLGKLAVHPPLTPVEPM